LEGIHAEIQHLQPAQLTKLLRHLPTKAVVAKVELPEEGEVAQERRGTSCQVERVQVELVGCASAARDTVTREQSLRATLGGIGMLPPASNRGNNTLKLAIALAEGWLVLG
jgi:hypothetical protein